MWRGIRLALATFIALSAISCSKKVQDKIVGRWSAGGGIQAFEFLKDGTVTVTLNGVAAAGNYRFPDENHVRLEVNGKTMVLLVGFNESGNELTLTDSAAHVTKLAKEGNGTESAKEPSDKLVADESCRESQKHLEEMGKAALLYAASHGGAYPPDLKELLTTELSEEVFNNPRLHPPPIGTGSGDRVKRITRDSDYVWSGSGKNNRMASDEALAWEKPAGLNGINILFCDGHVQLLPNKFALKIIQEGRVPIGH